MKTGDQAWQLVLSCAEEEARLARRRGQALDERMGFYIIRVLVFSG